MHRSFLAALCALAAAGAALPGTAAAALPLEQDRHVELIAYGESITRCAIGIGRSQGVVKPIEYGSWSFSGSTSCSAAVQQTGDAYLSSNIGVFDPAACSGYRASCASSGGGWGAGPSSGTIVYRVALTAPRGQGWGVAPEECSGTGTDQITCTFAVDINAYL